MKNEIANSKLNKVLVPTALICIFNYTVNFHNIQTKNARIYIKTNSLYFAKIKKKYLSKCNSFKVYSDYVCTVSTNVLKRYKTIWALNAKPA